MTLGLQCSWKRACVLHTVLSSSSVEDLGALMVCTMSRKDECKLDRNRDQLCYDSVLMDKTSKNGEAVGVR